MIGSLEDAGLVFDPVGRGPAGRFRRPPLSSLRTEIPGPCSWGIALEPHSSRRPGPAPCPSMPDLIIAATAELAGLALLYPDKDFDLIAETTAQSVDA